MDDQALEHARREAATMSDERLAQLIAEGSEGMAPALWKILSGEQARRARGARDAPAVSAGYLPVPFTLSRRNLGAVALLLLLLVILFGNYRIVSGAPTWIVQRQYFGFDEPFASVADCTTSPWIIASAQHGKLCADLQAAGVLESDEARAERVRQEIARESERIMRSLGR